MKPVNESVQNMAIYFVACRYYVYCFTNEQARAD